MIDFVEAFTTKLGCYYPHDIDTNKILIERYSVITCNMEGLLP